MTQPPFSASAPQTTAVVRMKPKAEVRAIRHGFPWVYSDEVVTDRRTKALSAGTVKHDPDAFTLAVQTLWAGKEHISPEILNGKLKRAKPVTRDDCGAKK